MGFVLLALLCTECQSKSLNEWRNQDDEKVEQNSCTENLVNKAVKKKKNEERKDQQEVVEVVSSEQTDDQGGRE